MPAADFRGDVFSSVYTVPNPKTVNKHVPRRPDLLLMDGADFHVKTCPFAAYPSVQLVKYDGITWQPYAQGDL